jgi:DNA-binding NarL/FixJ family response regulator
MKRMTLLLADDDKVVRREFRRILEREDDFEVVGEAKKMASRRSPWPQNFTKVLMLSAHSNEEYVQAAANSGAMGYLIKQISADTVSLAIRAVHKGNKFFSPSIPSRVQKRNRSGR